LRPAAHIPGGNRTIERAKRDKADVLPGISKIAEFPLYTVPLGLPGADVEATESATSRVRKQATNQDGIFEFPLIPRGTYTLSVSKSGFRKETLADIPLQVAEVRDLRITMSLGELSQSVSVDSSGTVLESSNAALSQVIDPKRVSQLPINGRNMMQLLGLAPGVTVAARASAT